MRDRKALVIDRDGRRAHDLDYFLNKGIKRTLQDDDLHKSIKNSSTIRSQFETDEIDQTIQGIDRQIEKSHEIYGAQLQDYHRDDR
jgi:hypothetical protein